MLSPKGKGAGIRNTSMKPNKGAQRKLNSKAFIQENFSDQQWASFDAGEALPQGKSEEMQRVVMDHISSKLERKQQVKLKLISVARYLSAASIILIVGWALLFKEVPTEPSAIATQVKNNPSIQESVWKEVANTGARAMKYELPDASLLTIYPGSSIRFERQFEQKLRNVYLKGKARFKVKRDPMRPFSVYSGALKTTALGTSFTINTNGEQISVKLHTGKIVVANTSTKKTLAYISSIGSTLLYDPSLNLARVVKAAQPVNAAAEIFKREGNLLIMKNLPLLKVLRLLNETYGIRIQSNQVEISSISFTGKVDTGKERPEDILKLICLINDMTLTKVSDEEFIIQKTNK